MSQYYQNLFRTELPGQIQQTGQQADAAIQNLRNLSRQEGSFRPNTAPLEAYMSRIPGLTAKNVNLARQGVKNQARRQNLAAGQAAGMQGQATQQALQQSLVDRMQGFQHWAELGMRQEEAARARQAMYATNAARLSAQRQAQLMQYLPALMSARAQLKRTNQASKWGWLSNLGKAVTGPFQLLGSGMSKLLEHVNLNIGAGSGGTNVPESWDKSIGYAGGESYDPDADAEYMDSQTF